jgi:hypothetical protein
LCLMKRVDVVVAGERKTPRFGAPEHRHRHTYPIKRLHPAGVYLLGVYLLQACVLTGVHPLGVHLLQAYIS